ncbi:MAG: tRNA pseudouridine(38-40) synthase TruA [Chloroflexi bacterium]|nr:tRNA pseudouridine(38-40) synthase TruA [Chloroflexota bacterium]
MRFKAIVAYDGTAYSGFQRQKNAFTIQEEIEDVLERLMCAPIWVTAAGRTDAGVHAEGQVIAFEGAWRHPITDLHRGMNALLSDQIAIVHLSEVEADFHPRFDAIRRRYRYTIYQAPVPNPLVHRTSLYIAQALDREAMQAAAEALVGRHDFAAFGSPPQGNNSVREVYRAAWSWAEGTAYGRLGDLSEHTWLYFDIEANAFLYRMVRMLVGTMLRVGYGALTPAEFADILHARDRSRAGPAIAACGLSLKAVQYE